MNVLEYIIRAKDESSAVLQKVQTQISEGMLKASGSAQRKLSEYSQAIGTIGPAANSASSGLASMLVRFAGPAAIAAGVVAVIKKAVGEFSEIQVIQAKFETLLGSLAKAKQRIDEIISFRDGASGGLFDEKDIAQASMNLEKLTSGVLAGETAWKMIGDVAAATGNTMDSVSFAVGKAFGQIAEGMSTDRAMMQLQQLGVIGPETIKTLKDLEDSGGTLGQKWEVVAAALEKYNGGMDKLKATNTGALAELKSAWNEWFHSIGEGIDKVAGDGGVRRLAAIIRGITDGRSFDSKTWQMGGNLDDLLAQSKAEEDAAKKKADDQKNVQDELAKRQAEIDKKLAEEKAHAERLLAYKLAGEAAEAEAKAAAEATRERRAEAERTAREAEETRKKNLRYSLHDEAAKKIDDLEGNKEDKLKKLDAAIEDLGKKAESAAERLRNATGWLADWGGQAGGEFGARGPGRREWVAGRAGARAQNAGQVALDKKDMARWSELEGRIGHKIKLSPEDQQWMDDQRAWAKKKKDNEAEEKKAKAEAAQLKIDQKILEDAKKRIAEETRDACVKIRDNLDKTLRAI